MAHTDKTTPARLWDHYEIRCDRSYRKYRCSAERHSLIADDVRRASRRQRRQARADLRRGIEPEPYRPRHRVQYDAL